MYYGSILIYHHIINQRKNVLMSSSSMKSIVANYPKYLVNYSMLLTLVIGVRKGK